MWLQLLVSLSAGLAVFGIGWLAYGYHLQISSQLRRQRQFRRLESLDRGVESVTAEADQMSPDGESWVDRLAPFVTGQVTLSTTAEQDSEDRRLLAQAGFRGMKALLAFQAIRIGLTVLAVLISVGSAVVSGNPKTWLYVVAAVALAYLVPKFVLSRMAKRRMHDLAKEIPLFIDYLRMMHGAGIGFEQSLMLFAEERRIGLPILAREFAFVRLAIKSGRARSDALAQMANQLDEDDLRDLVVLINDADRYGAGLQEPLKRYATRLMDKRRFALQDYVGKLATRMVVVMVFFLMPTLLIVTAGPAFLALYKALAGTAS